jgi:GAF domain-containing protein
MLGVPMLLDDRPVGAIVVGWADPGPIPKVQGKLLQTFATQAAIAIENTRLFEAEQTRTRELTESLEYQTATSDVLGVISRSPSQLQPVVDAIVQTAHRLCGAERTTLWRLHEDKFDLQASTNTDPALVQYLAENPIPTGRGSLAGRAVLEGRTLHVSDISTDPELGGLRQVQRSRARTMLAIPLLREGEPLGVLSLSKAEVSPFTDRQIKLVATFADQAVIAHREHPAVRGGAGAHARADGGAGAADGDIRGAEHHLKLARRARGRL